MTNAVKTLQQVNRRQLLKLGATLGAVPGMLGAVGSANSKASELQLSTPEDRFRTHIKLIGSLAREDVYISMSGELWGVMPGRAPEPMCGFQGVARANWAPQSDGSYLQRDFDIGFFSDLESGDPLVTMTNPFTGETIRPFHFKYGGDEVRHTCEDHEKSERGRWGGIGDQVWYSEVRKGEYPTPFPAADWPRESPGDILYAGAETSYLTTTEQLVNDDIRRARYTFFWTAFLSWEPWLLMDGVPGFVMWRGIGTKLSDSSEVPQQVRDYVLANQPNYFDDAAPWDGRESTYKSFKKVRKPAPPR